MNNFGPWLPRIKCCCSKDSLFKLWCLNVCIYYMSYKVTFRSYKVTTERCKFTFTRQKVTIARNKFAIVRNKDKNCEANTKQL